MKRFDELPSRDEDPESAEARARMRDLGYEAGMYGDPNIIVTESEVAQLGGKGNLERAINGGFRDGYSFASYKEGEAPPETTIHIHEPLMTPRRRIAVAAFATVGVLVGIGQVADKPSPYDNDRRAPAAETDAAHGVNLDPAPQQPDGSYGNRIYPTGAP